MIMRGYSLVSSDRNGLLLSVSRPVNRIAKSGKLMFLNSYVDPASTPK